MIVTKAKVIRAAKRKYSDSEWFIIYKGFRFSTYPRGQDAEKSHYRGSSPSESQRKDTWSKTSQLITMSEEKQYVTVRIPKFFDDLINKYIETHQEEMMLLGQRASRAGVVKKALYEFLKKEGIIQINK